MFGRLIPVRFALFSAIGLLGVGVHMAVLSVLLFAFDTAFVVGQIVAATVAMTANFFLNNALTYRDRRLRSEEHTSELQSLLRISYAVFCMKNKNTIMST